MGHLWQLVVSAFTAAAPGQRPALYHGGFDIVSLNGREVVLWVLEGYPAQRAGIRRGDIITMTNGTAFHPANSFADGGTVSLAVAGNGDRRVSLTPVYENLYDSFRSATAASPRQFASGNKIIGYAHFWNLSRNSNDLGNFLQIMGDLALCDGLILDLRNAYGYLSPAHVLAFDPNMERTPDPALRYLQVEAFLRPLVLVVNELTSAGAAEFANRLGRQDRIFTLGAGSDLVTPEIPVPYPLDSATAGDPQVDGAVSALLEII